MRAVAIAFVLLTFPFLVSWIKSNPRQRHWAYFGLGILPFIETHWHLQASLINWAMWPGHTKGMIISVLDSLALAVILTHRAPRGMPPLSGFIIAYFLAALLSAEMSNVPMASLLYAYQLLRLLILAVAVAKIANDQRALTWLAMGLAVGISYQAGFVIWQRAHGVFQAGGTMGHPNLLGLITHSVTLPLLAMLLAGMRNRIVMLGVASGLVVIALGASRGAIGFDLMGIASLIVLSIIRRSTAHKWRIVGMAILSLGLISPFMLHSVQTRLSSLSSTPGGYDERAAFERAAKAMFHDHPMGVGANQYVVVANTGGYAARAGVTWASGSRSTNVHNTYLLVAAETGWVGLASFLALFAAAIFSGLRFAFQNRRDPRGDVVLGCAIAMIVTALHNQYEWIWVTENPQYLFAITFGLISGMVRARGREKRLERVRRRRDQAIPIPAIASGSVVPTDAAFAPVIDNREPAPDRHEQTS
jgi:O-antigen ligase